MKIVPAMRRVKIDPERGHRRRDGAKRRSTARSTNFAQAPLSADRMVRESDTKP